MAGIIFLAAWFRLYGIDWDQGFHLHPDERMITMVAERVHLPKLTDLHQMVTPESPLNPHFFAYGSLPIYLLKFCGWLASFFYLPLVSYAKLNLVGRIISVIADLGTIIVLFLIGKNVFSKSIGYLAALFYSLSVLPIQLAHFYAVDTLLTFFITTTLYRLIRLYEDTYLRNSILVGIFFGLSLATKVSAMVLVIAVGITLTIDLLIISLCQLRKNVAGSLFLSTIFGMFARKITIFQDYRKKRWRKIVERNLLFGMLIAAVAMFTFFLFEPYALIDFAEFFKQTKAQQAMTKSAFAYPYTLQFVSTISYLYQLENLILWGLGIPLGGISLIGSLLIFFEAIKKFPNYWNDPKEVKIFILVVFFLAYFLVVGQFAVKFMRYLLPLYPLLALFAAWLLVKLVVWKNNPVIQKVGSLLMLTTVIFTLAWAWAFTSIYSQANTRFSASLWINDHIPQGSTIAIEHWDDRVPLWGSYQYLEMPMYDPDSSEKKWMIVKNNLSRADYLIISSNRLYVPLMRLGSCKDYPTHCYPKTAQYYRSLFAEELGFSKIAEFKLIPKISLLGISQFEIDDASADENFTVFDHPKILIFKRINPQQTSHDESI
jgi:hypothetical protein